MTSVRHGMPMLRIAVRRFVATGDASKPCVMLMSDSHYGYGADGKHMRVSLLRGALDPDPFLDAGENSFTLAIACKDACTAAQKTKAAGAFVSPLSYIHAGIHPGTKPAMGSYLQVDSNKVQLLSIRKYGKGMQVWMSMLEEAEGYAELTFAGKIGAAWRIDAHGERADGEIQAVGNVLCVSATAHEMIGVYVEMA